MLESYNNMEQDFLSFLRVKKGLSDNTISCYISHAKKYNTFLANRNPSIPLTEEFLHNVRKERKDSSYNTLLCVMKCLQEYYSYRHLNFRVWDDFKFLKIEEKIVDVLTIDEIKRLLETHIIRKSTGSSNSSDMYRLFFTKLLAFTGARFSEIAGLKVCNVYTDYILITHTKNKLSRKVYIPPSLQEELKAWIKNKKPTDYVVTNTNGSPMHQADFLLDLRKRCEYAGINKKVYPHLLRHSFATQLIIDGVDAMEVKEIIGHKSIESTVRYVHLADTRLKKSTFKHALFRDQVSPREILEEIKQLIRSYQIDTDSRFKYSLTEVNEGITMKVIVR